MRDNHSGPVVKALVPGEGLARDVALIIGGSILVALAAQVALRLPFSPVPITGQTFGVLVVGALLGSKRGAAAILAYLAEGVMGLPVFAGGGSGAAWLAGPTGGYLAGFVAAAFVTGWLFERGWDRRLPLAVVALVAGNAVIYLLGLPWLARWVGADSVLSAGLFPFLPGDALKLVAAAPVVFGAAAWAHVRGRGGR